MTYITFTRMDKSILPEPSLNNEINKTSVNKYPWLKL